MRVSSHSPLLVESSTQPPVLSAHTLSTMCRWWGTAREEAAPGICQWVGHPQTRVLHGEGRSTMSHLSNPDEEPGHGSHPSNTSLVLILGGVFFILVITAVITSIKRWREMQV